MNNYKLKERSAPAAQNEPECSPVYMRDSVRNATRYALITGASLDDALYGVQKATLFNPMVKALVTHFYTYEVAA